MQLRDFRLDKHVAIITGAGRGSARASPWPMPRRAPTSCWSPGPARNWTRSPRGSGPAAGKAITVAGDVRDLTQAPMVVEQAVAELGSGSTSWSTTPAVPSRGPCWTPPAPSSMRRSTLNVTAAFELVKQATPRLLEGGHGSVGGTSARPWTGWWGVGCWFMERSRPPCHT